MVNPKFVDPPGGDFAAIGRGSPLADSIASVGWDLNDQARRYLAWWHKGKRVP